MEIINPQLKEVMQKQKEFQIKMARIEGEIGELRRVATDTTRQTIWQFVIFTVTMAAILLGGIQYQTDTLRSEINARFEGVNSRLDSVNSRFDAVNQRLDQTEKTLTVRFEDLKQEVRANRK
jgi:peptidoglycan hydrolase CwlO-like protein